MTTEVLNRPVKYAALEWRNAQGEKFEAIQEGTLCYLKDEAEPYTGKAVELYENGKVSLEGEFLNGKAHGEETWWYENEQRNSLVTFLEGVRHGPHLVWYESGQLQIDVCYTHGKRDGRHAVYYARMARSVPRPTSMAKSWKVNTLLGTRTVANVANACSLLAQKSSGVSGQQRVARKR